MSKSAEIVIGTPLPASKWNVDLGITQGREIEELLGPFHKPLAYLQPPHPELPEIIKAIRQSRFCPPHVGAKIIPVGSIEQSSFLGNIDPTLADMLNSRLEHIVETGLTGVFGHRRTNFDRNMEYVFGDNGVSHNGSYSLSQAMEKSLKGIVSGAIIRRLYLNTWSVKRNEIGSIVIGRQDLAQEIAPFSRAILVGNHPVGIDVFRNILTFLTA